MLDSRVLTTALHINSRRLTRLLHAGDVARDVLHGDGVLHSQPVALALDARLRPPQRARLGAAGGRAPGRAGGATHLVDEHAGVGAQPGEGQADVVVDLAE